MGVVGELAFSRIELVSSQGLTGRFKGSVETAEENTRRIFGGLDSGRLEGFQEHARVVVLGVNGQHVFQRDQTVFAAVHQITQPHPGLFMVGIFFHNLQEQAAGLLQVTGFCGGNA